MRKNQINKIVEVIFIILLIILFTAVINLFSHKPILYSVTTAIGIFFVWKIIDKKRKT